MTIYIFVDMEGISGISGSDFVAADGKHYQTARRYYTDDLNACIEGCCEGGADAIIARDGHGGGNHLLWDQVDSRAEVIQGPTGTVRLPGIDECAGLILLGYHAMAGTRGALLEHTYSSRSVQNMWLNGKLVGELGIDAGVASDYGVPTIMVSGDDYVCREAKEWIPGVYTCQVKTGLGCQASRMLPRAKAHQLIAETATAAVRGLSEIDPMPVDRPVTIRKEAVERGSIPSAATRDDIRVLDGRTYEKTADTVEKAFFL